jgi:hypothetical protein
MQNFQFAQNLKTTPKLYIDHNAFGDSDYSYRLFHIPRFSLNLFHKGGGTKNRNKAMPQFLRGTDIHGDEVGTGNEVTGFERSE